MDAGSPGDDDDGEAQADDAGDGSDDLTVDSSDGHGTDGSDHEAIPEGTGAEISGCSVGAMGTSSSSFLGVMALGLLALSRLLHAAVRGHRRRRVR